MVHIKTFEDQLFEKSNKFKVKETYPCWIDFDCRSLEIVSCFSTLWYTSLKFKIFIGYNVNSKYNIQLLHEEFVSWCIFNMVIIVETKFTNRNGATLDHSYFN
jgi:hypothetical protein